MGEVSRPAQVRQFTDEIRLRYLRGFQGKETWPLRTICSVLREAARKCQDPEILDLLAEANWMAKRMNEKLIEYNEFYDDEWWEKR